MGGVPLGSGQASVGAGGQGRGGFFGGSSCARGGDKVQDTVEESQPIFVWWLDGLERSCKDVGGVVVVLPPTLCGDGDGSGGGDRIICSGASSFLDSSVCATASPDSLCDGGGVFFHSAISSVP